MSALAQVRRDALKALRPPPKLDLADWVEANIHLPSSLSAHPGRMRLWPHQVEIARSMGAPDVERVTMLKSARVGYTQLAIAALGNFVVNDPSPILVVLPADDDCRHMMTSNIEPVFSESPALRSALSANINDRDTLYSRQFVGGSLTLVSARAPRNLRARTAKCLMADEIDCWEIDVRGEGDPVLLAEKRTMTFANRKIIMGSTPVHEATSRICRAYDKSDQRIYECPCPSCGERHELKWAHVHWSPDSGGADAHWVCPSCGDIVEEKDKATFVSQGRWRATRPEVVGHHGYRISALVSLLPNASWPKLAAEFLEAKKSPQTLQTFVNTVLGEPWRDAGDDLDESSLLSRREPFGLSAIPADVLFATVGVDCQDDRLECVVIGHGRDTTFVLAHRVLWGPVDSPEVWQELEDLLKSSWPHPNGGTLRVDAAVIDSGDGDHQPHVYDFTRTRFARRIVAGKGVQGFSRPPLQRSTVKGVPLFIIGVDAIKNSLFNHLARGNSFRFSADLEPVFFEQLTSERRVVRYSRGQPMRAFERIPGKRAETLDATVYGIAARHLINMDLERREAELSSPAAPAARVPTVIRSAWLEGN